MNNSENDEDPLPDGWVLCQSKSNAGRKYYFSKKTGKSSWTRPEDVVKSGSGNKKTKKDVDERQDTRSSNDSPKKSLKRKSDGAFEEPSPKKKIIRVTELQQPDSSMSKPKRESPKQKPTPSKNSANKRLAQLRNRLSLEAQKEEVPCSSNHMKSPSKTKREIFKATPKFSQNETPTRNASRTVSSELRSPILSDPKCSTSTQSPSSDSLTSIPSPSQFLTASKIITSMKAQLPEEYSCRTKLKDTFAEIEHEISSLTSDSQFIKHPATPPQFSEASKIVSAIMSKLAYKCSSREVTDVPVFPSAKERLESLRSSLGNDVSKEDSDATSSTAVLTRQQSIEAMEVEESKVCQTSSNTQSNNQNHLDSCKDVVLVVDTNIFIHELDMIKNVLNSHIKGYNEQPTLIVPWRVVNELDRLKDNNGTSALCKRARAAMDYLYQSLPENNRIKGQSLRDANSHIFACESPDDEILNCCLQQAERGKSVILLSNDKNLCNKAVINGVRSIGLAELSAQLEHRPANCDPELEENLRHYETSIHKLLANILENEMRAKYNTLWQHVIFKPPPWALHDVLQCLLKHWLAVFNEVFPRIEHLITDLKGVLARIERKGHKSVSQSDVNNFKDLALEVAKKCQIIPEYMVLAKQTVERLSKKEQSHVVNSTQDDMLVVDAFENVWTMFSSYCAKLASGLGIPHSVEDKISSNESMHVLRSKWPVYSNQIRSFTQALHGVLNASESEPVPVTSISRLETVLRDSLQLISINKNDINKDNLILFCTKCKEMLKEAYAKFQQLYDLVNMCSRTLDR